MGMINGKAGKAAALPKFSDTFILSQSGGAPGIWKDHSLTILPCDYLHP